MPVTDITTFLPMDESNNHIGKIERFKKLLEIRVVVSAAKLTKFNETAKAFTRFCNGETISSEDLDRIFELFLCFS